MIINFWMIDEIIKYAAFIVWSCYSVNVVIGLIGRAFFRPNKEYNKTDKLELVLISVANKKVKKSLFETINHTINMFKDVPLNIVVDEGAELLDELMEMSRASEIISASSTAVHGHHPQQQQ